jgi:hypothetical protein
MCECRCAACDQFARRFPTDGIQLSLVAGDGPAVDAGPLFPLEAPAAVTVGASIPPRHGSTSAGPSTGDIR